MYLNQLTVENFGGSQDNLHFLGRNPDKQFAIHIGPKDGISNKINNSHPQENDSSGLQNLLQHTNTSPGNFHFNSFCSEKQLNTVCLCFSIIPNKF